MTKGGNLGNWNASPSLHQLTWFLRKIKCNCCQNISEWSMNHFNAFLSQDVRNPRLVGGVSLCNVSPLIVPERSAAKETFGPICGYVLKSLFRIVVAPDNETMCVGLTIRYLRFGVSVSLHISKVCARLCPHQASWMNIFNMNDIKTCLTRRKKIIGTKKIGLNDHQPTMLRIHVVDETFVLNQRNSSAVSLYFCMYINIILENVTSVQSSSFRSLWSLHFFIFFCEHPRPRLDSEEVDPYFRMPPRVSSFHMSLVFCFLISTDKEESDHCNKERKVEILSKSGNKIWLAPWSHLYTLWPPLACLGGAERGVVDWIGIKIKSPAPSLCHLVKAGVLSERGLEKGSSY